MGWGNLGIAMGAGVDEMHKQKATDREEAQATRQAQEWAQKQEEYVRQKAQRDQMDAITKKYAGYREAASKGEHGFLDELGNEYNGNKGAWNDGHTVLKQSTAQGDMAHFVGPDGKVARSMPLNKQTIGQLINDAHMAELQHTSPEMFQNGYYKDRDYGLKTREVGAKEREVTDKGTYQTGILNWHNKQAERPSFQQDGTGRILAISPDGKLLGTYGSARPDHSGGSGGGSGARENWLPIAEDSDGTPILYNQKGIDPKNPQASFVRPDGKPVVDMKGVYAKMTGNRPQQPPKPQITFEKAIETGLIRVDPKNPRGALRDYDRLLGAPSALDKALAAESGQGENRAEAPSAPYATRRGLGFVVVDPTSGSTVPVAEYERRTGNAWADLPVR